ncbi:ATP-binding cassette domain-containing protein, partial [Sphingomonas bacterium]|uniref:ATP-binding cassette domain-containing protein n=1 Tax=Sphingomonas bacterium TaxID=1895847 RepID=UPI001577176F
MTALLAFDDVWLEYGDKVVLERVTLAVAERSFVSIVGPSGAGKSSFLRLALGQEAPSRGRILLDGRPSPAECGPDRGVVFQRYSVFPHLTALRNVMFAREAADAPLTGHLLG